MISVVDMDPVIQEVLVPEPMHQESLDPDPSHPGFGLGSIFQKGPEFNYPIMFRSGSKLFNLASIAPVMEEK